MTIDVGRYTRQAITVAKRLGLTARVTITREIAATFTPASDTRTDAANTVAVPLSFTIDAVSESPLPEEPHTGGLEPQITMLWWMNAADCAFKPETGHTMTVAGEKWRVISNATTEIGTTAVFYGVEVTR